MRQHTIVYVKKLLHKSTPTRLKDYLCVLLIVAAKQIFTGYCLIRLIRKNIFGGIIEMRDE